MGLLGLGLKLKNVLKAKKVSKTITSVPPNVPKTSTQKIKRDLNLFKHEISGKMKKEGFEGPTYKFSGKKSKSGAHLLKEVWTKDPYK